MAIYYSTPYQNILNVLIQNVNGKFQQEDAWEEIISNANDRKIPGILIVFHGAIDITKYRIRVLTEFMVKARHVQKVALLKCDLPDNDELGFLSILKHRMVDTDNEFQVFYDELEALDWLNA